MERPFPRLIPIGYGVVQVGAKQPKTLTKKKWIVISLLFVEEVVSLQKKVLT